VIGGAYERPKIVEELEMALGQLSIEWVPVPDTSPCIGKTLGDLEFRRRTGVTVIAILREPDPVSGAQADDVLQQGDTVVTVGRAGEYGRFRRMLATGSPD
jgi:TrkA domain protein